jgi:uncharacterized delta-60 repeat protein
MVIQPEGKIVVVGSTNGNFALARYLLTGALDTSFSGNGKQHTGFGTGSVDGAHAVAQQADGKIVVAGTANGAFALARYNANGNLDTTFSGDGKVTTDLGGTDSRRYGAHAVALQADGKIVAAGRALVIELGRQGLDDFALARYNANGTLDATFGSKGIVRTSFCDEFVSGCDDFDDVQGISALARRTARL